MTGAIRLSAFALSLAACGLIPARAWDVPSEAFPGVIVRCASDEALSAEECRTLGDDLAEFHMAGPGRTTEVIELRITGSGESRRCLMTLRNAAGTELVSGHAPCGA